MVTILKKGSSKARIKKILEKLEKIKPISGIDAFKYCGLIRFDENPLLIQKGMRDEWE